MVICKAHLPNDSYSIVALSRTKTYKQQQQIVKKQQQNKNNITKKWKKKQQQKHPKCSIVGLAKAFSDVARSYSREAEAEAQISKNTKLKPMLSWSWEEAEKMQIDFYEQI